MSTAERLKYEGWQEGLQEGLQKGRQETIIDFLALRFKQVPERVKDAIRAVKQEDQLRKLLRASGTCDSIEAFTKAF